MTDKSLLLSLKSAAIRTRNQAITSMLIPHANITEASIWHWADPMLKALSLRIANRPPSLFSNPDSVSFEVAPVSWTAHSDF